MSLPNPVILRTASGTAYGAPQLSQRQLRRLLEHPDDLLWRNLAQPVKISHDSLLVEAELPLAERVVHVAYKRYLPRNGWKVFLGFFRRSRALEAWRLGHALLARGISTAPPVVALQPAGWRWRGASYLATEWIEGAENLHLFGWRLRATPMDERLRLATVCAKSLGHLLGRMHAAGVSHRDLKGANLLVVERRAEVTTYLVDLDGVRMRRSIGAARRAADLARLAAGLEAHPWVTRAICCRFLRAYAAESSSGVIGWKPLWRAIAARSLRIVRRKERRGQEVL